MLIGRIVVALVALPLAAGCMVVVDCAAHPAPGLAPRPLIGQPVSHALLDDSELAKPLRQYCKSKPQSPPRFGGRDQLYDVQSHIVTTVSSARAFGVRANCLVEVDVAFFCDAKPDGTAVDLAHAMMDKVSSLS